MPVPDHVIFGPNPPDGTFTYGQVRTLEGDDRYSALKHRFDTFLIAQINELGKEEEGKSKVYSPFPLFLLTCIAIEALGKALYRPSQPIPDEDAQREGFLTVCSKIDPRFSRQLCKKNKEGYDALWGKDEHKKVKSLAHVIYRFGRHTMVHGFRGKGVYLTEDFDGWKFIDGAFYLNPYWFWRAFKSVYEQEWGALFENKEATNALKRSADEYLKEILE